VEWREQDGIRWLEAELPAARAAFSTRLGGVSEKPYDSLNLGVLTGDDRAAVLENRRRLADALGLAPELVLMGRQVHRDRIADHDRPLDPSPYTQPGSSLQEVDGHATSVPGLAPLVLVADCLPVALAGPGGVAMLHCGWRGLAGDIIADGAARVNANAAAIGPGVGGCCYEVGPEVLERFTGLGDGVADGPMLDLTEVARRELSAAGVERIESSDLCTSCEAELFFSARRDGKRSGRQGGFVRMTVGEN
jgi:polyphenol oxidase